MKGKLIFEEAQSFTNTRLWYIMLALMLLSVTPAVYLVLRENTMEALWAVLFIVVVMLGIIWLFTTSKLYLTLDGQYLYYRYPPYIRKERKLGKADIKELYVRQYKPIWEYGGYGYRYRFGAGTALNVSGNKGLQLILSNGKKLLIGTQKPHELERAIRTMKENWSHV
jgi:hypothetical protein